MRVGVVRTDLGNGVYLADLRSNVQRPQASSAPGQARVVRRPTDAEWNTLIGETYPLPVILTGSDTGVTVDTSVNDTLKIRRYPGEAYTVIAVTSGISTAKTTIRDDLNTTFTANNLPFLASVVGTNQLRIVSTSPNLGTSAILDIDTIAGGSTLNTPAGFADGATEVNPSLATQVLAFQVNVYPTSTTIDVSSATILSTATAVGLSTADQAALVADISDMVAPQLVETGNALRSFAIGSIAAARAATFQPDGLPAGVGLAVVEDDGSTPKTYQGV